VPDQASDDYVARMAGLFKEKLNPHCKLYVAYSNECWNGSFRQYPRIAEAAKNNTELTATQQYERHAQQVAWQARRVGRIFREQFGADRAAQIQPVFEVNAVDPNFAETGLKFLESKYGPPAKDLFAIAGTSYFNLWEGTKEEPGGVDKPGMTLADYFDDFRRSTTKPREKTKKHRAIAERYDLRFICYEGGTHVTDFNGMLKREVNGEVKKQAWSDSRMATVTANVIRAWQRDGGQGPFMWYNFCAPGGKWGRWGLLESIDQPDGPRWEGVMNYLHAD
jgi:hypothetical protein